MVTPPFLGATKGASFLFPSLYSTRTSVVENTSVASFVGKYLSLKNELTGERLSTAISNV